MTGFGLLKITDRLLIDMLETGDHSGGYRVNNGVPADARVVGGHRTEYGELVLTLASDAWEPLQQGCLIPFLNVSLERL